MLFTIGRKWEHAGLLQVRHTYQIYRYLKATAIQCGLIARRFLNGDWRSGLNIGLDHLQSPRGTHYSPSYQPGAMILPSGVATFLPLPSQHNLTIQSPSYTHTNVRVKEFVACWQCHHAITELATTPEPLYRPLRYRRVLRPHSTPAKRKYYSASKAIPIHPARSPPAKPNTGRRCW